MYILRQEQYKTSTRKFEKYYIINILNNFVQYNFFGVNIMSDNHYQSAKRLIKKSLNEIYKSLEDIDDIINQDEDEIEGLDEYVEVIKDELIKRINSL
jgi:hypothetical protein